MRRWPDVRPCRCRNCRSPFGRRLLAALVVRHRRRPPPGRRLDGEFSAARPLVFDGEASPGASTGHHPVSLERELIGRLTAFAGRHNSTLFMCLLTGLKALLLAQSGRSDISVASAMANRAQPDTDRVVVRSRTR